MMSLTGRCLCGQIRYSPTPPSTQLDLCHCKNCQRQSGTAFLNFLAVPLASLSIDGTPREYQDKGPISGNVVRRHFCECWGSPLHVVVESAANTADVTASTLDDTPGLTPRGHGWVDSQQPLGRLGGGIPTHDEDPGLTDTVPG